MSGQLFSSNESLMYALEGQKLCKRGKCLQGIVFFEKALIKEMTNSYITIAIYNEIGNAYYFLQHYNKAMEYHHNVLDLAILNKDLTSEARAYGNLCITFKALGNFEKSILCCNKHLEISSLILDEVGRSLAYYNKGNIYYSLASRSCQLNDIFPGIMPNNIKECLVEALGCFETSLKITEEIRNDFLRGKCIGNLGNVHYLLGQFNKARQCQMERLKLATHLKDIHGMRRAHSNLGNCFVFLEQYSNAIRHYEHSAKLSREIGDQISESRARFSIGNVHLLLNNFPLAIQCYRSHLEVIQQFRDEVDEARCWWSLSEVYKKTGDLKNASQCKDKYLVLKNKNSDQQTSETDKFSDSVPNVLQVLSRRGKFSRQ